MDKKEYIINEVGLEIARENLAKEMKYEIINNNNKEKIKQLIKDRDELDKGSKEIIKKYVGELKNE